MIVFKSVNCTADRWAALFIFHHGADALADEVRSHEWKQMTIDERMEIDKLVTIYARKVKTFLELPELP